MSARLQARSGINPDSTWTRESNRAMLRAERKRRKEAHQMPTPRWLVRLTIPLIAAGAALASSAAIATADPQDDAYLAALRAVGLHWPPQTEEALIGEAHYICYDLTWGWQPQAIADDIHDHLNKRGVTLLDVGTMVNAAHKTYCPGNVCADPACE